MSLSYFSRTTMKVEIDLPDTAPLAGVDARFLQEGLVALLYEKGVLSEREACDALGIGRRAFEELLLRFGFVVLSDDPSSIDTELNA